MDFNCVVIELETLNFSEICRTCQCVSQDMVPIFENPNESPPIDTMLTACCTVQVLSGDGLPPQICTVCLNQLKSAYCFKTQAERIDAGLRECLRAVEVAEMKQEENPEFISFPNLDITNDPLDFVMEDDVIEDENKTDLDFINGIDITDINVETDELIEQTIIEEPVLEETVIQEAVKDEIAVEETPLEGEDDDSDDSDYLPPLEKDIEASLTRFNICTRAKSGVKRPNKRASGEEIKRDVLCQICGKAFDSVRNMNRHSRIKHEGNKLIKERKFDCPHCDKSFVAQKHRDLHVKGHNELYTCAVCNKTIRSKHYLTQHMKLHDEGSKKYSCSICDKTFVRKDYYVTHLRRHSGEKPFKCSYCDKGFSRKSDLTTHERYHTGEKTHFCKICGKGFVKADSLTIHMRTHTGEKPYRCTYCQAAFAQRNDLKGHVRRHTGEKFQCPFCTESFDRRHVLIRHKKKVHGFNGDTRIDPIESPNQD